MAFRWGLIYECGFAVAGTLAPQSLGVASAFALTFIVGLTSPLPQDIVVLIYVALHVVLSTATEASALELNASSVSLAVTVLFALSDSPLIFALVFVAKLLFGRLVIGTHCVPHTSLVDVTSPLAPALIVVLTKSIFVFFYLTGISVVAVVLSLTVGVDGTGPHAFAVRVLLAPSGPVD